MGYREYIRVIYKENGKEHVNYNSSCELHWQERCEVG